MIDSFNKALIKGQVTIGNIVRTNVTKYAKAVRSIENVDLMKQNAEKDLLKWAKMVCP